MTQTQISLFDYPKYKITKPIRLIELFGGIGAQAKALERMGVDFEHYRLVEFDKYAVKSYNAIHGTNFNTQDIRQTTADDLGIADTDKYEYIMTYSFPCQALSQAGLQKGMAEGSGTSSSLLWEVKRLLQDLKEKPQILLMENVSQVHGKKFINDFNKWLEFLAGIGYTNYWQDLNAKDYGIPQNRLRTFMISIYGKYSYEFPKPFKLEKRLSDVLEKQVDEKYYLNENTIKYFQKHSKDCEEKGLGFRFAPTSGGGIARTLSTHSSAERMDSTFIKEELP